jgi:molybdopterin converting factor small subunit
MNDWSVWKELEKAHVTIAELREAAERDSSELAHNEVIIGQLREMLAKSESLLKDCSNENIRLENEAEKLRAAVPADVETALNKFCVSCMDLGVTGTIANHDIAMVRKDQLTTLIGALLARHSSAVPKNTPTESWGNNGTR